MDLTIVIPHRGNGLGLWATIHSCEEDLKGLPLTYNFVIVSNGEECHADVKQCLRYVEQSGHLLKHVHFDEALTPPAARQVGADIADGRIIAFLDNHCLVSRCYFERAILDIDTKKLDMLHSATCIYTGDGVYYHYTMRWDYNFWGESARLPHNTYKPYQCAVAGHGGFFVTKEAWDAVGGYGPSDLLVGYGGEEVLFDVKMWRLGRKNWIDPKLIHYHYTGPRGYDRHYTDDYYTNQMIVASVIGGPAWLDRVFESFSTKAHIRMRSKRHMYDLYGEANVRSAKYAAELNSKALFSLDELMIKFREDQVAT